MSNDSLILLPHLDDEFALCPIFKNILKKAGKHYRFIFFAERNEDLKKNKLLRREECIKSLSLFGVDRSRVIFINDYFSVDDLKLHENSDQIKSFLTNYHKQNSINKIYTINLEGGHPDHDSLALIVDKFCNEMRIKKFFLPAYNYRRTLFLPLSVLRPLNSQLSYFKVKKINFFDWHASLKIAFIYKSERAAFIKLLPFLILKTFFSYRVYIANKIDIHSIDWEKSFTKNRYKTDINLIIHKI